VFGVATFTNSNTNDAVSINGLQNEPQSDVAATKTKNEVANLDELTLHSRVYREKPVTLSHGEFRAPAAPGASSEIIIKLTDKSAFGTLNGKDVGVVVFTTSTGGSGTFYELALLFRSDDGWINTDVVLLGDREKVEAISLAADRIDIQMLSHGPRDPQCCPTQKVTKRFAIQDERLVTTAGNDTEIQHLIGPVWAWSYSRYNNDTRQSPVNSDSYTLQFHNNGSINIKADCNLKAGKYTLNGKQLSIRVGRSTRVACEPGSLENVFVRDLTAATNYFIKERILYIDLKFDSGTMVFKEWNSVSN